MASRLLKGKGYVVRVPSIDIAEIGAGGGQYPISANLTFALIPPIWYHWVWMLQNFSRNGICWPVFCLQAGEKRRENTERSNGRAISKTQTYF